jgi:hypothetical protein
MIEKKKKNKKKTSSIPLTCKRIYRAFWGRSEAEQLHCGLVLFGFSVITINPHLITNNDIWRRFSQMENHRTDLQSSLGTNFAET